MDDEGGPSGGVSRLRNRGVNMFLVMYDIQDTRLRTKFSKFLERYGRRIQYSVFEIANSRRLLENIEAKIRTTFERCFTQGDNVLIFDIGDHACIRRFGYPVNEESDLVIR